jgi:hypothetical protein
MTAARDCQGGMGAPGAGAMLRLADDSVWSLSAAGDAGSLVVSRIAEAMRLTPTATSAAPPGHRLVLDAAGAPHRVGEDGAVGDEVPVPRQLRPQALADGADAEESMWVLVNGALRALLTLMEPCGILLAHAALIARDGCGVLLAGHGSAGKTTAALRVGEPWTALCDDSVLLVPAKDGAYWAHPWPTWSAFLWGGPGMSCATETPVHVGAVAFIRQEQALALTPLTPQEMAVRLAASASQIAVEGRGIDHAQRASRVHRFSSACRVARRVPGYTLGLDLDGPYWGLLGAALESAT